MVHTIALQTGEWEAEAEAAEVFLVLRLEDGIQLPWRPTWNLVFTGVSLFFFSPNKPELKLAFLKRLNNTQPDAIYVYLVLSICSCQEKRHC